MTKMLYNVRWADGPPTIEQIREKYGFSPDEVDEQYGVIEIDPHDHLYSILVEGTAVARVEPGWAERVNEAGLEGPFADPRIEPCGPPEP